MVGDDDLYRIITPSEGCYDKYSSVSEFKEHLAAEYLSSEKCKDGWVFWVPERDNINDNVYGRSIPEKIRCVLTRLISSFLTIDKVQFWALKEVGGRSILTISDQPFAVRDHHLRKGIGRYRKTCMGHPYIVDDGAQKEQRGPPGRVFRNGRPESSPDLRLYSVKEFPLRDHAASCGERSYLALPVFDLHHNQCVGVLEFVSCLNGADILLDGPDICHELQVVGMRTTHLDHSEQLIDSWEPEQYPFTCDRLIHHHGQPTEIIEMLELALKTIPQFHLAQVMTPCQCCGNRSNSFNGMKLVASIIKNGYDSELLHDFFLASQFHNLQNGQGIGGFALSSTNKSCFCQNVSDFSILDYPIAHYAQVAGLSFCFAICLRNMMHHGNNNDLYVFEFFLQPQSRDPTNIWFVLRLLLKIMEDTLKGFKLATGRQLAEKLIVDEIRRKCMSTSPRLGQNNIFPFGFEVVPYGLEILHQQHIIRFSVPIEGCDENYSIFEFREYLQKPNLHCFQSKESENGFICYPRENDELLESGGSHNSTLEFPATTENIMILMRKIISIWPWVWNYLIQIWEPKEIKDRLYLSTSDQPFALGYLGRGLCLYRKQCMEHLYYVGDGAKEEELGPPGRVFLTGHLESSPDLRLYSAREFPLLVHVVHCGAREYWVLPLFDLQRKNCLGILECVGWPCDLEYVPDILKEVNLRSTHVNYDLSSTNIVDGRKQAVAEIQEMFKLLELSPQIRLAFAWMPCSQCDMNIETFCMERVCDIWSLFFGNWEFQKVNVGKGVAGRVLESENKMCYFENPGDFSILDYSWAHDAQDNRFESCFAICLRSSLMENDLYVLEFFMLPGCNRDGYPRSYLSFLLSVMKRTLKSFKVASGQQLGEHLLKTVRYGHERDQMKNFEQEQNIIGINSNEGDKRGESKTSFHLSYEDLEPHFGKRLVDAANDLGVSRSKLKRARKECGIRRWPSNVKNRKNPSLFQTKTSNKYAQTSGQQISKACSSNLPISDFLIESNVPQTCIEATREVDKTCQKSNVVTIKAKFKEDIVKFDLCHSSGLEKLVEEVAKRLHLTPGNFKLKYKDDDDDLIWLTCDEDWHNHVKSMRSLSKTTVYVLVQLVSE